MARVIFFLTAFFSIVYSGNNLKAAITEKKTDCKLLLLPEKNNYYLGENILLHYALINEGKTKITVNLGGDYRGAWRAHRFKVFTIDANNDTVPDPYPSEIDFGGLSSDFTINPRDTFFYTLQLNYFSRITKGGKYTVYVKHDLGWKKNEQPTGRTEIVISEPDSAKAKFLTEQMFEMEKEPSWSYGKKRTQFADFNCIRNPVFFQALSDFADKGNKDALEGLGSLYCKEASWKLLAMLGDNDTINSRLQLDLLSQRIPLPKSESNYFNDTAERLYKVRSGWIKSYSEQSELIAVNFLKVANPAHLTGAAYVLKCVATRAAIFPLMKAMSEEIKKSRDWNQRVNLYPSPLTPLTAMSDAVSELLKNYSFEPIPGSSEGQDFVFLLKLKADPSFRPENWEISVLKMTERNLPAIDHAILECLPASSGKEFYAFINKSLSGENITANTLAAILIQQNKGNEFDTCMLNLLKRNSDEWLLGSVRGYFAGRTCFYDAMKILAANLTDSTKAVVSMDQLRTMLIEEGSGSFGWEFKMAEAKKLQADWNNFLNKNEAVLKSGRRYHLNEKIISKSLFPASYEWILNNGKRWPSKK